MNLEDAVLEYADDPLGYALFAFPWGEPGPLENEPGPDVWQADVLATLGAEVVQRRGNPVATAIQIAVASGHGVGKSALVAWILLWFMSTRPTPQGVCTANTRPQLEAKTWRELAKWHKLAKNHEWFEWTATKFYLKASPENWFCSALAWTKERSEAFAGTHEKYVLFVYDEASAIDDQIWEVSEGAMTTPGAIWIAFGNPTRNTGRFRQCFGKLRHRWITRQVDSRTARMANRAQIQQWIDDYGEDSDFVRVRVRGVFPRASAMQFIGTDIVEAAQEREVEVPRGAPRLMGVDVARYGDDQSVIARRHGRRLEPLWKYRELDLMQLAAVVAEAINREHPDVVYVDEVGMGSGVVDRLHQLGYQNVIGVIAGSRPDPVNRDAYYNKRAEMWARMKEWLKGADIPDDGDLYQDLIGPEYGFDNRMRLQLERKEDMKARGLASPDSADALAFTFAHPTPPIIDMPAGGLEPPPEPTY